MNPYIDQPGLVSRPCRVHINRDTPHIWLMGVRYGSQLLSDGVCRRGAHMRVLYDPNDLRTLQLVTTKGRYLGVVRALGAWGQVAHNVAMRQTFLDLQRRSLLPARASCHPVTALLACLLRLASNDHQAEVMLCHVRNYLRGADSSLDRYLHSLPQRRDDTDAEPSADGDAPLPKSPAAAAVEPA